MILILLSWLLMLCVCYPLGFVLNKFLKLNVNTSLVIILGIILLVNLANLFSFFFPLDVLFLVFTMILSLVISAVYKTELITKVKLYVKTIFHKKNTFIFLISVILYAGYSSAFSSINDDGLYYIQTSLWLKKYGLVHGLSNLHVSLGLCSSWHVFQTVFSFSENINFNDINGFLMLIFTLYFFENTMANKFNIVFYFQFLLTLVISLPFYSAPNPDLAVIVLTMMGIHLFSHEPKKNYPIVLLIASFGFTIKISALVLFVLGIYLTLKNYATIGYKLWVSIIVICSIHIAKNIYQTAYPLYPIKAISLELDWKTPEPIMDYYLNGIKTWAYSNEFKPKEINAVKDKSHFEIIGLLLSRQGSKGLINKIIFIAFLLSTVLLLLNLKNKKIINMELHIVLGVSICIWFVFSPQYRFAIPMLIFYLSFLFSMLLQKLHFKKINYFYIHAACLFILAFPIIFGFKLNANETSKHIGTFNKLEINQLVFPKPQYKFEKIDTIQIRQVNYFHVNGNSYCWNSPLPCMSAKYQKIISDNFGQTISTRGIDVEDGFKFVKN